MLFSGLLPPNKGLLQHVLRISDAPQHPISNGEEQTAMLVKRRQTNCDLLQLFYVWSTGLQFLHD
jgi:hypothetical protein